ncbi:MAG TPA: hypothetical protein VL068_07020, partial [Microthrixaceae bacterium]|nr:hypothetical protein [Microthrixaceae bacterium]
VPAATIQGATASATPFDTPPPFAPSTYTPPPFNPESLNLEPPNLRGVATPSVSAEPVSSEPTAIPVEPEAVPLSGDVAATIAAAALAASVVDSEASSTGDSQATEAAAWLKPRATGQRAKAAGSEVGAGAGRGTGRASEGPARSDSRSEGKSASGSKRGSGTTPPRRSKRGDKEHVLFAPGGGMPAARQMGGQATQVPAVLRDAMSRLSAQSVRDAAPVLEALVSALDPGEKVGHLIQGWAKGLACVVARTDKRVIIVVNRFPEPLVERLHPTRTGISLYGPPGVDHVSVAIVDGRRLLEVSGVLDRAEAMAMRTDHGERPTRRRGYF